LREASGLTQEELAEKAYLSAKNISDLERGKRRRPYPHTVRSLADALGLSEEERADLIAAVPKRGNAAATTTETLPEPTLPLAPTPLVGRERDLEEVKAFLGRPEVRLLTLTGTGGIGKTRLAMEAAREAADLFPNGAAFVALAPLNAAELVVLTVARSLGLRETEGRTPREALCAYLREKRFLLVLDNFEHLLAAAPEMAALIESCPDLTLLVTSRAPLRVRGEQEWPVPPLALPISTRSPAMEEVLGSPSGRLFVERARAASPAFELEESNAAAVAAICWRLAGLPLALELAAVRIRFLSPSSLLARLDRALSAGWARDVPDRQRTMRATLDWSHDLLSEPEKVLFRRLSVFFGGFSLEAAETVNDDDDDVVDPLARLVEQSLVTTEQNAAEDEVRYGMLEPVRQYGKEKLEESGEAEEAQRRHAAYFLDLAERAAPELTRAGQAASLERLGREHDNLRAALRWLLIRGDIEGAARIGWGALWFWYIHGHISEGRGWMERALRHGGAPTPGGRAMILAAIGALAWREGDNDRAEAALEEGERLARKSGDLEVLARALLARGYVATNRGEGARAEAALAESGRLYRGLGDPWGAGLALMGGVHVALAEGDPARAERLLAEAEEPLRASGAPWGLGAALSMRALLMQFRGDDALAVPLLRESVALSMSLADTPSLGVELANLAGALATLGWGERAARLFGAAEALRERTGLAIRFAPWHELYERHLEALRAQLDADELAVAWAEGRVLAPEEAVAEALAKST
jgi:predicted ATPase/DNA-binding XRE family transcriptional regulator